MKKRAKIVIEKLLNENEINFMVLMDELNISKRTLYYDLEKINQSLKDIGHIAIINQQLIFIGNKNRLKSWFQRYNQSTQIQEETLFYELLRKPIEQVSKEYALSISSLQSLLQHKMSQISNERQLRNTFIRFMHHDQQLLVRISPLSQKINNQFQLNLSDYSLAFLSEIINYIQYRLKQNIQFTFDWNHPHDKPDFYTPFKQLLPFKQEDECRYVCAYALSLSSREHFTMVPEMHQLARKLAETVSLKTGHNYYKDDFISNLAQHLSSSYYRIKYNFPLVNPLLETIKHKHLYLFYVIKQALSQLGYDPLSEDELSFITLYFGSYETTQGNSLKRILIVCPFGLMISKSIESQLLAALPGLIEIQSCSMQEYSTLKDEFDLILTTIDLIEEPSVFKVEPILTRRDIQTIYSIVNPTSYQEIDYHKLLNVISRSSTIVDKQKLIEDLYQFFHPTDALEIQQRKERGPMLSELINASRVQTKESVDDWQTAISIAAKPLLEQGCIQQSYINRMIQAVLDHGPYVILADQFALPHASNSGDVLELSMALLRLNQPVDFLGQPVKTVMVLATIDNTSHLRALSFLANLLFEEKNLKIFIEESTESILKLIHETEHAEKEVRA